MEAVRAAGRTAHDASSGSRPLFAARTLSTSSRRAVTCRMVPCDETWIPVGRALTWMFRLFRVTDGVAGPRFARAAVGKGAAGVQEFAGRGGGGTRVVLRKKRTAQGGP